MEANFKFELGDFVYVRSDVGAYKEALADIEKLPENERAWPLRETRKPVKVFIVDRIMEQCHGGIQYHYGIRLYHSNGASALTRFTEPELAKEM